MKVRHAMILTLGLLVGFASCGQKKQQVQNTDENEITEENAELVDTMTVDTIIENETEEVQSLVELKGSELLNDAARFVAGLPVMNQESKLYALTQTVEWKNHAKNMDQIWNSFLQTSPKVTAFSQNELSDINKKCKTLFYPFGGPDFLFSNTFFPDMDTYFLIGLERAGSPVKVEHPSNGTYRLYQNAVSDILNLSFFRTKDMKVELSNDTIDGVLPIITLLMARADREIISIENKKLNENGDIIPSDGKSGLVEIKYFKRGTGKPQTLYYLSTDLSNGGFSKNKNLQAFINKLNIPTTATFIKSASYLMHENYFSQIRDAVLAHSSAIMQDDSGIPWRFYDEGKWDITLYGTFSKPIALFSEYPQTELRDEYQKRDPKPLNFRIGYARQSNEQVSRLK